MTSLRTRLGTLALLTGLGAVPAQAGTLTGHVRDPNWFAQRDGQPVGVGYYEYAVNANADGVNAPGGHDDTDVFGAFQMGGLPDGRYTVASWDVWWRSTFAFDVDVSGRNTTDDVDLRLAATMWGYPAFWDDQAYVEHGQTFEATGPVTMIYLRNPLQNVAYRVTVHEDGPGGNPVGVDRTFSGQGDHRLIYGYGDMPTEAGRTYYVAVRSASPRVPGILRRMDPRPDGSDPMPGGCLWLGDARGVQPVPDQDLGLIIMSDDDGLLTNLFTRHNGSHLGNATRVGQSFVARGASLVSAAFWVGDPSFPVYQVAVFEGGPDGVQVGTPKQGRPARPTADPEMLVTWRPGECPLTPGQIYYIEVSITSGGLFHATYVNSADPYPFGTAFLDGVARVGTDLAGTLMEEVSPGSATLPRIRFVREPAVDESRREPNQLTVTWTTDVAADSGVAFAIRRPPYTRVIHDPELVQDHAIVLPDVPAHSLVHYEATSHREGYRRARSRDRAITTRPSMENLLVNPGFEIGSGSSPRSEVPGWVRQGVLDIKATDGTWFAGVPPHAGTWLLQGAINGGNADAAIYQRVTGIEPGRRYTFSAWLSSWMIENDQFKYDVWNDPGRLIHFRIGLDPTGGINPDDAAIQWSPRVYSHLRYSNVARTVETTGEALTVFVRMQGQGGQWQIFGVDECILTPEETRPPHLLLHREKTYLEFQWLDPAWSLQHSDALPGDWTSGETAASPYRVTPSASNRIFRLRSE